MEGGRERKRKSVFWGHQKIRHAPQRWRYPSLSSHPSLRRCLPWPLSYLHSAPQRLLGGTCHGVCLVQDHYLMSTGREDDLRARGRDGGGEGGREGWRG